MIISLAEEGEHLWFKKSWFRTEVSLSLQLQTLIWSSSWQEESYMTLYTSAAALIRIISHVKGLYSLYLLSWSKPREMGIRWESRGSNLYQMGLCGQTCVSVWHETVKENLWEPTLYQLRRRLHHSDPSRSDSSTWHPKYAPYYLSIVCWTREPRLLGCLRSWMCHCSRWSGGYRGHSVHNHSVYCRTRSHPQHFLSTLHFGLNGTLSKLLIKSEPYSDLISYWIYLGLVLFLKSHVYSFKNQPSKSLNLSFGSQKTYLYFIRDFF